MKSRILVAMVEFAGSENGATAVEYAVMLGLVFLACILGIGAVGSETLSAWTNNSNQIQNSVSGS